MNEDRKDLPFGPAPEDNAALGALGAFLFALVGGVIYYVFYTIGFLSWISGCVAVICAIKGYTVFTRKETKRGLVISIVMAALVIVLAWYVCVCLDIVETYRYWFEMGEIDYTVAFWDVLPVGFYYLADVPAYLLDLLYSVGVGAFACWGYVANRQSRIVAIRAQKEAQARTKELNDLQAAQAAVAEAAAAEVAATENAETAPKPSLDGGEGTTL